MYSLVYIGKGQYGLTVTKKRPEYVWLVLAHDGMACIYTKQTYVYQIRLISHVQVMDDRCFIQMRKLCHVVCLVKLGRIDFVYALRMHFSLLKVWSAVLSKSNPCC